MTKKNRRQVGDRCIFLKSMREVEVKTVWADGYTVRRVDTGKELFATEAGLSSK